MKRFAALLPLVAAAALAGCQDAQVTAPDSARLSTTNQAPVAVINNWHQKPVMLRDGRTAMRFEFHGRDSYDPDGTIVQYYWYPQIYCRVDGAYGDTYYMNVPEGETCGLTLTVTDNSGATTSKVEYFSW